MPRTMSEEQERKDRSRQAASHVDMSGKHCPCASCANNRAWAELDAERSAHEETRRDRDEAHALGEQCVAYEGEGIPWSRPLDDYAQWVTGAVLNERIRRASVDLAAAQARIAELEAALRRITQAHQDAAYDHEAQRAAVFNFVGNVAENALSASSPKDALRSVCEKVAREMDRVTSKDIEDDWPGTTDQRIDEVVSSIIGEVKRDGD